jgi:hypothetical protein
MVVQRARLPFTTTGILGPGAVWRSPSPCSSRGLPTPHCMIAFEQKEREYLLWGCFRSSFASSSTPAGCLLLIATNTWPG